MPSLFSKIQEDLNNALLRGQTVKISTLRLLISAVNNAKIAKGSDLTDEEITREIQREVKKRREAIEAFRKGKREDLVLKEKGELKVLEEYLPKQMSKMEIEKVVKEAILQTKAKSIKDIGQVMSEVMKKTGGRVDGRVVSDIVKAKLLTD